MSIELDPSGLQAIWFAWALAELIGQFAVIGVGTYFGFYLTEMGVSWITNLIRQAAK